MKLNPLQVRTLIAAHLRLDLRHPKTGETRSSRAVLSFVSYALTSVVLALALAERGASMAELLYVGHSFAAVLAAFAIAGSYDDLMGRPREHAQALLLPVTEQTLYAARMANILLFGGMMAVSAAIPLTVYAALQLGPAAALVVGISLVATMLGVMLAVLAGVWWLLLQAPLRVQRPVLSAVRAGLIALLVVGYQVVATQPTLVADAPWWIATWVVSAIEQGSASSITLLAACAVGLTAAYGFFFPARYGHLLRRTASAETMQNARSVHPAAPNRLERLFAVDLSARAGFGLAAGALSADRLVRGRVWPAALLAIVFGIFGWWSGGLGDLFSYGAADVLLNPAVQMHLSVLTMLLFASLAAIQGIQVSDHPEAGWVYGILPQKSHRGLQIGAQQAILLRVLLPAHAALGLLLTLSMPAFHALLHVAFWFAGCAVITRIQALMQRQPPLTRHSDRFSAGERFVPLLLAIPAAMALVLLQSLTFTTQTSALLLVVGLLVLHGALGRFERLAGTRGALATRPHVTRPAAEALAVRG